MLPIAPEALDIFGAWMLDAAPVTATEPEAADTFSDCVDEIEPEIRTAPTALAVLGA
jgi:hypothetical protein